MSPCMCSRRLTTCLNSVLKTESLPKRPDINHHKNQSSRIWSGRECSHMGFRQKGTDPGVLGTGPAVRFTLHISKLNVRK